MISLLHPSRGRPEQAMNTFNRWAKEAQCPIEWLLAVDKDDPALPKYHELVANVFVSESSSIVEATNAVAAKAEGNILLFLSDDFFCFPGWGRTIMDIASRYKDEFLIKVNDGLQRFENDVLTIPIMSRVLYHRLGYFWYPEYKSIYADNDLYHVCKRRGALKLHPEINFRHAHPSNGTAQNDDTYIRSHANYEQGRQIFDRRKKKGFK